MQNLRSAVVLLAGAGDIDLAGCSSVYQTMPVGEVLEQRDFYNAVVRVETRLDPHDLLDACKQLERELGREEGGPRHSPRPIDIDLLLLDDVALSDERLVVPHPEIGARRFVLLPLSELDPELTLPDGRTVARALAELGTDQRAERVSEL